MSIAQGPSNPRASRRAAPFGMAARARTLWSSLARGRGDNSGLRPVVATPRRPGNAGLVEEPRGWLGVARRWSAATMPPGLGVALFVLAFQLARHSWQGRPVIAPGTLIPLAIVYVVGGLVFGLALSTAPTLAGWLALLLAGLLLYPLVTAAFLWGWTGAMVLAIFMGAAAALYARRRIITTADHQVQITRLGRTYLRTLRPGTTMALPGERVLASLETSERSFDLARRQVRVESAEGVIYIARAAAQVTYHLVPRQAHRALIASARWEDDLRETAARTLDDALADWAVHMLDDDEPPEGLFIARAMIRRLRERVRGWGVHVETVNVQHIGLNPESETIPATWTPTGPPPRSAASSAAAAVPPPPIAQASKAAPPPLPEDLSPDALSDFYEAVRLGRITDPATIRGIAHAFLGVAADPALNDTIPYDAVAAARILLDLAATIDGEATQAGAGAR